MNTQNLFGSLGTELVWQVILSGFAVIAVVAAGVPLLQKRRLHPALLVGGALLAVLSPFLMGRACLWDFGGRGVDLLRLQVVTFAACHLLAPLTAGPAMSFGLLFWAVGGARGVPRAWWRAGAAFGLTLVAAAIVLATGWATGNHLYATIRFGAYTVLGALAAVGTIGSGPDEEGGADAAAASGAAIPLLVGLGEASERGLVWLIVSQAVEQVPTGRWDDGLEWMLSNVSGEWFASHAALAVACLAAIPGAHRAGTRGAITWVVAAIASWALLLGSDLGARADAMGVLVP